MEVWKVLTLQEIDSRWSRAISIIDQNKAKNSSFS